MKHLSDKKLDLIVVVCLNILGFLYAILTKDLYIGKAIYSTSVIAIPSIIYMGLRKKKEWHKIILFTLIFGLIFDGLLLEFFAEATNSWNVLNPTFPVRFFGILSLDAVIGQGIISTSYIAVFYEHFFHHKSPRQISSRLFLALLLGLYCFLAIFLKYEASPQSFKLLQYPYIIVGTLAVIPTIYFAFTRPIIFKRMAIMGIYFFFMTLTLEIMGVSHGWWSFVGNNFVGWVQIGSIKFPFEDLFYWMLFYPATLVFFYEFFIDGE